MKILKLLYELKLLMVRRVIKLITRKIKKLMKRGYGTERIVALMKVGSELMKYEEALSRYYGVKSIHITGGLGWKNKAKK